VLTQEEKASFLERGYLLAKGVLDPQHLHRVQEAFDKVWEAESPSVAQHKLLKYPTFIELIEHPAILGRHQAIFGDQTQLLQYDLLRQGPKSDFPYRAWHRDFSFPGDIPLSINTILYLDDMTPDKGLTYVVPGSHRGTALPPKEGRNDSLPGEIGVIAEAGDAVFINSAIWHSGGRNASDGLRRGIYLYYGYWWLKRYGLDQPPLPYQAFEGASEQRLRLLGVKMPQRDLHMYDPTMGSASE
jgi:ectoine hydroxylase-related dioxygenase (phytanoyl-CoA dioxygenase family)